MTNIFDKNVKNTYTSKIWAIGMTTALLFAYTPIAIADPLVATQVTTEESQQNTSIAQEDEDPASANRFFEPTTLTDQIILGHANDLGVDVLLLKEQLFALADMTKHIESDNKKHITNPYSGAMSYYQFLPDSVVTAVNRLEIMMKQQGMGRVPAWASKVHKDPSAMYSLSMEQQRLLMIVNILEQQRTDEHILQLATGNNEVAKTIYYKYHHTAPDTSTKNRTEELFAVYFPNTI